MIPFRSCVLPTWSYTPFSPSSNLSVCLLGPRIRGMRQRSGHIPSMETIFGETMCFFRIRGIGRRHLRTFSRAYYGRRSAAGPPRRLRFRSQDYPVGRLVSSQGRRRHGELRRGRVLRRDHARSRGRNYCIGASLCNVAFSRVWNRIVRTAPLTEKIMQGP